MGRYEFDLGPLVHVSQTCIVVFGTDLEKGINVALKFMRDPESFEREQELRRTQHASFQDAVINIQDTYVRDGNTLYGLGWSKLEMDPAEYPCCIVMPRGDRALQDVVSSRQNACYPFGVFNVVFPPCSFCTNIWCQMPLRFVSDLVGAGFLKSVFVQDADAQHAKHAVLQDIFRQLVANVGTLHSSGVVHGDLKPVLSPSSTCILLSFFHRWSNLLLFRDTHLLVLCLSSTSCGMRKSLGESNNGGV
jgi:serine/threonine protein kinase